MIAKLNEPHVHSDTGVIFVERHIFFTVADLSLLDNSATNLRAQLEVGPWEHDAVWSITLGCELCGSVSELVTNAACMTGFPLCLDCRARREQGGCGLADVAEEGGLLRAVWARDGAYYCLVVDA